MNSGPLATRDLTPSRPRGLLAGLLSTLLPGAGQLWAGRTQRGLVMLATAIALALAGAGFALRGTSVLLGELVQPPVLIGLLVANALVFVFRAHCAVDAYRSGRRTRLPSLRAVAIALLLAVVAVPHVVAGYYVERSYDVLTSVFASEEPVDFVATGSLSSLSAPVPSASRSVNPSQPALPSAAQAPSRTPLQGGLSPTPVYESGVSPSVADEPRRPAPPEEEPSYWENRGRVNVLLVGGDAGPYRYGIRTDTMIVVSIETKTRRAAVFGVPRNLTSVPLPPSARTSLETFPDILNALWGYAESHPEMFPGAKLPGPTALKETIGSLLAMRIDYFAAVDLRGFVEAVDVLGGVTVNVQRHVWDAGVSPPVEGEPLIAIDLEPGRHHLDGRAALAYVRTRWASSDYDRMRRQRCLVGALTQQASPVRLLKALPKIASMVKKYVVTDIPLKALPDLIELVTQLDAKRMVGVSFAPPAFSTVADPAEMRAAAKRALSGRPDPEIGLETVRTNCG